MSQMSDAELVRLCCGADSGADGGAADVAFGELFARYRAGVLRSAYLIVGNRADSENVLQDTFVKVWQNLPALKNPDGFRPWLMRIMVRTAWDCCRRRGQEQPVADVWDGADVPQGESSLDVVLAAERADCVWAAVQRLDVKHRTVVVLYYYDELPVQEIARVCGVPVGTVKTRLWAARRRLRVQLRELGGNVDEK